MSKLTCHQLGTIFKKTFGLKKFESCATQDLLLETLFQEVENFRPPCHIMDTYIFSERVPIFATKTLSDKSDLVMSLMDHQGEVAIVADSVLTSLFGLHLVTLTSSTATAQEWFALMDKHNVFMHMQNVSDNEKILISKLSSFIKKNG